MPRVDHINPKEKQPEYYADMPINLDKNLVTGNILRLTNDDAIKQALVSLVLTDHKERPYQPWIGSKIKSSLFGLIDDPSTIEDIKSSITRAVETNEPRVKIENIQVFDDSENNGYNIRIAFSSINIQQVETVDIFISRVR